MTLYHVEINDLKKLKLKIVSHESIDTADTGTGDHENFFAQLDLNGYLTEHDSHLLDAQCVTKAIRIRAVSDQIMWPNIPKTTLLFSDKKIYHSSGGVDLDHLDEDENNFTFYPTVKPHYG